MKGFTNLLKEMVAEEGVDEEEIEIERKKSVEKERHRKDELHNIEININKIDFEDSEDDLDEEEL